MDISSEQAPAISVLVPIYNTEKYLRQALDSLRAQTFASFEAILINDGSTDGSRVIMQEYLDADARFRVIDKPNSGYGASMNRGLDEARGAYVAILEPDDFYEPDTLAKFYAAARTQQADVVRANYWFYWSSPMRNQLVDVTRFAPVGRVFNPRDELSIFYSIPCVWAALYRADMLRQHNVRFLETPGASFQDMGFSFKVWASAQRVYQLDCGVLHYRQDNEASSVNDPRKVYCICDEQDSIRAFIANDPQRPQLERVLFRWMYDSYIWNYTRLDATLREEFLQRMVADFQRGIDAGQYDPSLFNAYQSANLRALLKNPQKFLRTFPANPTQLQKAAYYFKVGGPKALLSAVKRV